MPLKLPLTHFLGKNFNRYSRVHLIKIKRLFIGKLQNPHRLYFSYFYNLILYCFWFRNRWHDPKVLLSIFWNRNSDENILAFEIVRCLISDFTKKKMKLHFLFFFAQKSAIKPIWRHWKWTVIFKLHFSIYKVWVKKRTANQKSQKYAFIEKSTIFFQSLSNFVKMSCLGVPYFD